MKVFSSVLDLLCRASGRKRQLSAFSLLIVSGDNQASVPEALHRLESICQDAMVPCLRIAGTDTSGVREPGSTVLICGCPTPQQLSTVCRSLRQQGKHVVIVLDALHQCPSINAQLSEMDEQLFQLSTTAAVKSLLKSKDPFSYAYAKGDNTATVAIFLDDGQEVLVIKRAHDPYQGCESLPGGFLKILLEDMPHCGAREVREETGIVVRPDELKLIDVRSAPDRDVRGHVVDHGYMWLVPAQRKAEVLSQLKAGDDAAEARFLPVSQVLSGQMAFDHRELLLAALKALGK